MRPFEDHLLKIAKKVTVQDSERQIYTKDFDKIRDMLFYYMKNTDSIFRKLFKGPSLFGSYSNNVRINCPNEFDVHMTLSPPYARAIIVVEDKLRPGFVHLNFSNVLDSLSNDCNHDDVYDFLYDATDRNSYLIRGRVQEWLEDLFEDAVYYYQNQINGYNIQYSKRGLAHTVFASNSYREISIDFVPAFIFGEEDWMSIPTTPEFQHKCDRWYAIPKPTHGVKRNRRISFMICNPNAEHHLLLNRQNLKMVIRLLKSLCKAYGLHRLKSYFITTAFLFEIEEQEEDFWYNSVDYIFVHMLDVLCEFFEDGNLPFFWNNNSNLLDILHADEILEYKNALINAYNKIQSYRYQPFIKLATVAQHFKLTK